MTASKTTELLKKVRKIEYKTRGLSNQLFSGGYHSAFKGRGMSFSEVREYQPGDDVRSIDWNVTARFGTPYVKVFEEERELTVMLLIDVSGSTFFGTRQGLDGVAKLKSDILTEICAVLSFSAINNNDKVGVLFFTDKVEKFIPPKKGKNHILRIIRELVDIHPEGKGSDIAEALRFLTNMMKKRAIVFLMSDFMHTASGSYKDALSIARRRHDMVGIQIFDDREKSMPKLGLMRVQDPETGKQAWVDTSSSATQKAYSQGFIGNQKRTKDIFNRSGVDLVRINTKDNYMTALMNLFKMRGSRK